jgi:hypothetical protein
MELYLVVNTFGKYLNLSKMIFLDYQKNIMMTTQSLVVYLDFS